MYTVAVNKWLDDTTKLTSLGSPTQRATNVINNSTSPTVHSTFEMHVIEILHSLMGNKVPVLECGLARTSTFAYHNVLKLNAGNPMRVQ